MPIYEYRCQICHQLSTFFVRSVGVALEPICSSCGSADMQRRMSAFAMGKTTSGVHASTPTSGNSREYYSDPRNIGRHVEDTFTRHGVEMPATVRESIDAARGGEVPKGMQS